MKKKLSILLFSLGFAMILGSAGLLLYTMQEEHQAEVYSAKVVDQFCQVVTPPAEKPTKTVTETPEAPEPTEEESPTVELDGTRYLGILTIPQLGLELPIAHHLSYAQLKYTPAVYAGTIPLGNLIIGGHNYGSHFGRLTELGTGDKISLIDAAGNLHHYALTKTEWINGNALNELFAGDWDLTLFTCLYENNTQRTILRFEGVAE